MPGSMVHVSTTWPRARGPRPATWGRASRALGHDRSAGPRPGLSERSNREHLAFVHDGQPCAGRETKTDTDPGPGDRHDARDGARPDPPPQLQDARSGPARKPRDCPGRVAGRSVGTRNRWIVRGRCRRNAATIREFRVVRHPIWRRRANRLKPGQSHAGPARSRVAAGNTCARERGARQRRRQNHGHR